MSPHLTEYGKWVRGKQMGKYFLSFKVLFTLQSPLWYYLFPSHFILDLTVWWVWSFLTNWCWLLVGKYSQPKHNSWGVVEYFIAGNWNARILLSPPCVWSLRGEIGTNWRPVPTDSPWVWMPTPMQTDTNKPSEWDWTIQGLFFPNIATLN